MQSEPTVIFGNTIVKPCDIQRQTHVYVGEIGRSLAVVDATIEQIMQSVVFNEERSEALVLQFLNTFGNVVEDHFKLLDKEYSKQEIELKGRLLPNPKNNALQQRLLSITQNMEWLEEERKEWEQFVEKMDETPQSPELSRVSSESSQNESGSPNHEPSSGTESIVDSFHCLENIHSIIAKVDSIRQMVRGMRKTRRDAMEERKKLVGHIQSTVFGDLVQNDTKYLVAMPERLQKDLFSAKMQHQEYCSFAKPENEIQQDMKHESHNVPADQFGSNVEDLSRDCQVTNEKENDQSPNLNHEQVCEITHLDPIDQENSSINGNHPEKTEERAEDERIPSKLGGWSIPRTPTHCGSKKILSIGAQ